MPEDLDLLRQEIEEAVFKLRLRSVRRRDNRAVAREVAATVMPILERREADQPKEAMTA